VQRLTTRADERIEVPEPGRQQRDEARETAAESGREIEVGAVLSDDPQSEHPLADGALLHARQTGHGVQQVDQQVQEHGPQRPLLAGGGKSDPALGARDQQHDAAREQQDDDGIGECTAHAGPKRRRFLAIRGHDRRTEKAAKRGAERFFTIDP
jgi:hypothetical protein